MKYCQIIPSTKLGKIRNQQLTQKIYEKLPKIVRVTKIWWNGEVSEDQQRYHCKNTKMPYILVRTFSKLNTLNSFKKGGMLCTMNILSLGSEGRRDWYLTSDGFVTSVSWLPFISGMLATTSSSVGVESINEIFRRMKLWLLFKRLSLLQPPPRPSPLWLPSTWQSFRLKPQWYPEHRLLKNV